jgi:squalene-hopene/tetraprenyl-beta-curcumene cyclase
MDHHRYSMFVTLALLAAPAVSQQWSPQLAARYLDVREQEWFDWEISNPNGKPCLSCHTGLPYLMVRPELRRRLGETEPTKYETGLLQALRSRVPIRNALELYPDGKEPSASQSLGVEAILSCMTLAMDDIKRDSLSAVTEQAFDRLWSLQIKTGDASGSWQWNSFNLDPYETPESPLFGASLAALAVAATPSTYRRRADVQPYVARLKKYLRTHQASQPLHNQLLSLWAATKLGDTLGRTQRKAIRNAAWQSQLPDGSWTLAAVGPWKLRLEAPADDGASSYATAFTAYTLLQSGVPRAYPRLARALNWLERQQVANEGFWDASSMNKHFESGSMQIRFMRDAATSWAVLALLER